MKGERRLAQLVIEWRKACEDKQSSEKHRGDLYHAVCQQAASMMARNKS